ncbi:MAG TPA: SpoIID/LytB domain-containing protein [Gemmatimonadaceae bacterium]|nr:SpoIID/LytB domain-containing protein [Gemmatimonadaceae bacterium]
MRRLIVLGALLVACSTRATGRPSPGRVPPDAARASIRVAVMSATPVISGTGEFSWFDADGSTELSSSRRGEPWRIERDGGSARVRAVRTSGEATPWRASLVVRAEQGYLSVGTRRYRGQLLVAPFDDSVAIVNRLPLEDYLRGVVAVEMGSRAAQDSAAVQAQAVAARSYAVLRLGVRNRPFDVYGSVMDQAYGGLDAENAGANAAVESTRGLVLKYDGRVVDAPYSSTCGGTTAEADEVWRNRGATYLRRVSDRIGTSTRYYCDIAPRYRWTTRFTGAELNASLARYLASYASVPSGGPGRARGIEVVDRTESGRVGTLRITTDGGQYSVQKNAARFVLRNPSGEILNSTYFSVDASHDRDGVITALTLTGQGYGHGIGMCQWGAIGRSRAGQSFRSILATYYPGTTVGPVE